MFHKDFPKLWVVGLAGLSLGLCWILDNAITARRHLLLYQNNTVCLIKYFIKLCQIRDIMIFNWVLRIKSGIFTFIVTKYRIYVKGQQENIAINYIIAFKIIPGRDYKDRCCLFLQLIVSIPLWFRSPVNIQPKLSSISIYTERKCIFLAWFPCTWFFWDSSFGHNTEKYLFLFFKCTSMIILGCVRRWKVNIT